MKANPLQINFDPSRSPLNGRLTKFLGGFGGAGGNVGEAFLFGLLGKGLEAGAAGGSFARADLDFSLS